MKKNTHLQLNKCYLFIVFILILVSSSYSQVNTKQRVDTGSMRRAIYLISKGQHDKAKMECIKMLQKNPTQVDASVLLARIYSWENRFDTSREMLLGVLQNHPVDKGALNALINVELWSGHYDQASIYADRGLAAYPNSEDLLIKKAKVYEKKGKYSEASNIIKHTLQINPNNKKALTAQEILRKKILLLPPKNGVGIYYQRDQFDKKYSPWNLVSANFYSVRKWGVVSASVNYANRFKITGVQYELNLYPRITRSTRAYIGGGYSKDIIFPNYKFGASLYQKFFKIAEVEVGARYLSFRNLPAIAIYTGGLSVTSKHWRGAVRSYLTPQGTTINQAYQLSARYMFNNPNNRITLSFNTGLSPKTYYDTVTKKGYNFPKSSSRVELRGQTTFFSNKTLIRATVGYEKNEYYSGLKRARMFAGIGIERLF